MFGIGMTELMVIFVIGLLVLGPKRLPELARSLGKSLAEFRRASTELRKEFMDVAEETRIPLEDREPLRSEPRPRIGGVHPEASPPQAGADAELPPQAGSDMPPPGPRVPRDAPGSAAAPADAPEPAAPASDAATSPGPAEDAAKRDG